MRAINIQDLFPAFLQILLAGRRIQFHAQVFAQPLWAYLRRAIDLNLIQHRPRLDGDDDFDAIAFGLAKNSHVLKLAGAIKRADIFFGYDIVVRPSYLRSHLRQHPRTADRGRSGVLHVNRMNDRRTLTRGIGRRLRPSTQCDCNCADEGGPCPTAAYQIIEHFGTSSGRAGALRVINSTGS